MDTHILFFILAGLLIAILIGTSIWSAKREKSRIFSNTFSTRPPATPIKTEFTHNVPPTLAPQSVENQPAHSVEAQSSFNTLDQVQQQEIEKSVNSIKISLTGQEPQTSQAESVYTTPSYSEQNSAQAVISVPDYEPREEPETVLTAPEVVAAEPQMITLYVVAAEGQQFRGDMVVQQLESLGFQFGEYQIFHRHLDNSSSPVLFSVANMMQPGVFDLDSIDQFATVGLVFFMHLPSVGNDLVNLRLLLRTVESFAQTMNGFVLDDQHQLLDDNIRQAYLLRVSQA